MEHREILLVEGTDDRHVIKHIRERNASCFQREFSIKTCSGIDNLLKEFPLQCNGSDVEIVGAVVDADGNVGGRWQSLRDRLKGNRKLPRLPNSPPRGGYVSPQPPAELRPRIGIWMMPDNSSRGTMEDFLYEMIRQPDLLLDQAEECIDDVVAKNLNRFRQSERKKALLHTWLAWQKQPGRPYGTAIAGGTLDSTAGQAPDFVQWLSNLFR